LPGKVRHGSLRPVFPTARTALFTAAALAWAASAAAQPMPSLPSPALGPSLLSPAPSSDPAGTRPAGQTTVPVSLSAALAGDARPIRAGLVWRVYEDRTDPGAPAMVAKSASATPSLQLAPGSYIVHAAYGYASASKRIAVQSMPVSERLSISAGALKLGGAIGDTPIPAERISFSVFVPIGNNSEGRLVLSHVRPGDLVRLPDGMYHVVSTYGESNAIARSDLRVDPGRVTEATLNHRAATVTLKLVAAAGGEAFAGTAFSVLTPGGDIIREAIGAFPTVTLAEGEYTLIARHEGQVYTRDFNVESGLDRDIEVLAKVR
jgi:hypothetical protein